MGKLALNLGMPPYLPSTEWFRNKETPDTRHYGRWISRTLIESNLPEGMVLTVPVQGGSSAVKRLRPGDLTISGHGDWTRIHLGAIEAAYGREPYFQHFFSEIAGIISDYPVRLPMLNLSLLAAMLKAIDYSEEIEGIRLLSERHPERYHAIRARLETGIELRHSLLEPLFRFGKDTLFLI